MCLEFEISSFDEEEKKSIKEGMNMFDIHKVELEWGGRTLSLETGQIARQADGAVLATYGETKVLATVVAEKKVDGYKDFFPLSVHYQEKAYAAGKIPGGFFKREGRPSESEVLISRLIDRPIRPLFVDNFKNETQVLITVLSHDFENDPDIVSMIAASAALTISGLPFLGPIAGARVGYQDGNFILNPTIDEVKESSLDLVVAGTRDGVLMVESEAKELAEDIMLEAVNFGHQAFQPVIETIIKLAQSAAKAPWSVSDKPEFFADVEKEVSKLAKTKIKKAYKIKSKQERYDALSTVKDEVKEHFIAKEDFDDSNLVYVQEIFKNLEKDVVRQDLLKTGNRIDGRDTKTVRPIDVQTGILPRTHGSALFTRGETQALVVTTLGTGQDEQIIDSLTGEYRENFLLHYNFPPYSVGEVGRVGSPGRREIGHGKLAWRSIHPLMPSNEEFPYAIRAVSEVTESNGSSSMATVCGTSLALMDAGVPLPKPIAGIAMGLIKEGDDFVVLTDIMGDEDHLGDMDFKVAGTDNGITALQMDIKITSVTSEIMQIALQQAKDGRIHILGEMSKALTEAKGDVSDYAPKMETFKIEVDKIRDVIGTGGKVIKEIIEKTGAKVDIDDDGNVKVAAVNKNSLEEAISLIKEITDEPEIGSIYQGSVVKIMDFGAFIRYFGRKEGLVHVSEIQPDRVENVSDVLNEGDEVWVKLLSVDGRGKTSLSMRVVDQETGELIEEEDKKSKERKRPANKRGSK